jgi:hypothetical protein
VVQTSDGGFLIADTNNRRVRKVIGGMVTTVAGNGVSVISADGGPATAAQLTEPSRTGELSDGGFLIAGEHGHSCCSSSKAEARGRRAFRRHQLDLVGISL